MSRRPILRFAWILALLCACSRDLGVGGPAATGFVVGRCVDGSGAPLSGAVVRFHKNANSVKSDRDGRFQLEFSFDAHFDSWKSVVVVESPPLEPLSVPVELKDGERVDLGDLKIE